MTHTDRCDEPVGHLKVCPRTSSAVGVSEARRAGPEPAREHRLVVDFEIPGVPPQHYRAERCAAQAFAAEAKRLGRPRVTIDDRASATMKPLPCQRLFLD